jgi:tripartite-type tricarboxylate transporter receptor subunit TctC
VNDLLAGNVSMMFANPTSTVPQVKAGKLRALAILGDKRNEALPAVPTAVEAGYPQFSEAIEWYGVVAPAATPRETLVKLNAAVVRALRDPDVSARLSGIGQTPSPSTPEAFAAQIRSDYERWGKVVKASGAKVE